MGQAGLGLWQLPGGGGWRLPTLGGARRDPLWARPRPRQCVRGSAALGRTPDGLRQRGGLRPLSAGCLARGTAALEAAGSRAGSELCAQTVASERAHGDEYSREPLPLASPPLREQQLTLPPQETLHNHRCGAGFLRSHCFAWSPVPVKPRGHSPDWSLLSPNPCSPSLGPAGLRSPELRGSSSERQAPRLESLPRGAALGARRETPRCRILRFVGCPSSSCRIGLHHKTSPPPISLRLLSHLWLRILLW